MRNLLLPLCLLLVLVCNAQSFRPGKLDLALQRLAADASAQTEPIHLLLKGDVECITAFVEKNGGHYKYRFRDYANVILPIGKLLLVEQEPCISAVVAEIYQGRPLLDKVLQQVKAKQVHAGASPLPQAYQGEGVIIGIIDAGIDLHHPDFMNPDSSTRVIELWDQTMPFDALLTPTYGYGQVWDSASINAGLCPHQDQPGYYGHGTNSAGIAAGNGFTDSNFTGVAPKSELIVVSSNLGSFSWSLTVADAVDYIFSRASALGRPCVINISLGSYLGSHDARDAAGLIIDGAIEAEPGRAVVCAAGNSGEFDPYHLGYDLSADTNFTWFVPNGPAGNATVFLELWADTGDFELAHMAIGADRTSPDYLFQGSTPFLNVLNLLGQTYTDTLFSQAGAMLAKVQAWAELSEGRYKVQFYLSHIDSLDHRFRLMMTGSGRFDLWSAETFGWNDMVFTGLPNSNDFPDIVDYIAPDNFQSIVSAWACSDKVVTVGNYINRNSYVDVDAVVRNFPTLNPGALALSSSWGPARTGSLKPDVAAPGDMILAPGAIFHLNNLLASSPAERQKVAASGWHHRVGGTSSASPVVAGIAALFFEKCPMADWQDFKAALGSSAITDTYTGNVPNVQWGKGKANALGALLRTNLNPALLADDNEFCDGGSLPVGVDGLFEKYLWMNGDTSQNISANASGLYVAQVWNEKGCMGYSDTLAIFERPNPAKPFIVLDGNNPFCPGEDVVLKVEQTYGAYDWSTSAHTDTIVVGEPGNYFCEVHNIYNCNTVSDTLQLEQFPGVPPFSIAAGNNLLFVTGDSLVNAEAYQWYLNGEAIPGATTEEFTAQENGNYTLEIRDENGCSRFSEPFAYVVSGIRQGTEEMLNMHPNPATDFIVISGPGTAKGMYVISDQRGVIVRKAKFALWEKISIAQLPAGVYHLSISLDGNVVSKRIVKI